MIRSLGLALACALALVAAAAAEPRVAALPGEQAAAAAAPLAPRTLPASVTAQQRERLRKAFDAALGLTGLIVTKLDGTAKGGVLAAIAQEKPIPVYFIGVGEKLEDLETFNAREFSLALLGQP